MAQCKSCGKKGFFLSLSEFNLCSECDKKIAPQIRDLATKVINDKKKVDNAKNLDVKFNHSLSMLKNLSLLYSMEKQGIKTITPSAKELIYLYQDFEFEYLKEKYFNKSYIWMNSANNDKQKKTTEYDRLAEKLKYLRQLKEQIMTYKKNLSNSEFIQMPGYYGEIIGEALENYQGDQNLDKMEIKTSFGNFNVKELLNNVIKNDITKSRVVEIKRELNEILGFIKTDLETMAMSHYNELINQYKALEKKKDYSGAKDKLENALIILSKEGKMFLGQARDLKNTVKEWIESIENELGK